MQHPDHEILQVIRSPFADADKKTVVSALLSGMPPQTPSVKVFTQFGHWNQDEGVLDGEPDWKSISDVIEQELQKCVEQSAIHGSGREQNVMEILSIIKSPAMDSVKTSCLTALIPQMSLNTTITDLLVDLGGWNKASARFDGAPDWHALADAIESKRHIRNDSHIHCEPADGAPAAVNDNAPAPVTDGAGRHKKQRVTTVALSHEQWIAKLELVALGAD
jgi:hypothetical protein